MFSAKVLLLKVYFYPKQIIGDHDIRSHYQRLSSRVDIKVINNLIIHVKHFKTSYFVIKVSSHSDKFGITAMKV